jgi:hypothetical protein
MATCKRGYKAPKERAVEDVEGNIDEKTAQLRCFFLT